MRLWDVLDMKIELPIPPSVNNLYAGMGRKRTCAAHYQKWQYKANGMIVNQGPHKPFAGAVEVTLIIQGGIGFSDTYDMDNLFKAVLDRLKNIQLIVDDCARYVPRGHWEYLPPTDAKTPARCWVEITEISGETR